MDELQTNPEVAALTAMYYRYAYTQIVLFSFSLVAVFWWCVREHRSNRATTKLLSNAITFSGATIDSSIATQDINRLLHSQIELLHGQIKLLQDRADQLTSDNARYVAQLASLTSIAEKSETSVEDLTRAHKASETTIEELLRVQQTTKVAAEEKQLMLQNRMSLYRRAAMVWFATINSVRVGTESSAVHAVLNMLHLRYVRNMDLRCGICGAAKAAPDRPTLSYLTDPGCYSCGGDTSESTASLVSELKEAAAKEVLAPGSDEPLQQDNDSTTTGDA